MHFVWVLSVLVCGAMAIESNFYREEACANAKGYCVLRSECPQTVSAPQADLCSGQKKDGAVCCPNFPENQVNCLQRHNVCRPSAECPGNLNIGRLGCASGETCCVLTK
ncbi:hypothetical protein Zmor_007933 [Zophobas morio]|uniref:Uncharacterized protein n=1 Tax=Zophobas morio TaxID=2755281 RepID=A0AA38J341_9CUCU|nr:hypothetical protein Zmor_007933 [Zophobas morio]